MAILATIAKPEYNNVISANPTGSTYAWSASTGVLDANFADTIGTTDSIQIFTQGYQFAWKPDTVNVIDDTDIMTLLENVNPNATAQVWNNKLTYVGTTASTSDEFVVDGNQLKHSVRMVAPPRLPSGFTGTPKYLAIGGDIGTTAQDWASIDLYADGVSHRSDFVTSDDLSFVEISSGKEIYRIPHITIIDDAGNEMSGQYKLVFGANNVVTMYMLCPWDWLQQAQYPIIIDPTVVVASAYDTSGNGGRKIVHLSNGWIVATAFNSNAYYFYVSKDNGQTWVQLCYTDSLFVTGGAIASIGTVVHLIAPNSSGNAFLNMSFDASTIANTKITAYQVVDNNGLSSLGTATITSDGNGNLQAAYSSKSTTYANSMNIRYSKGTVSGTTVTWASPTQITNVNTSGYNITNPCIAVTSSNNPVILYQQAMATNIIACSVYNGSAWSSVQVYGGGSYTQSNPCAAIDSNGVIHCVWYGTDSTDTAKNNVRYSKSTDGGNTWSTPTKLTSGNSYGQGAPTITADTNNDLFVFWEGIDSSVSSTYTNIRYLKYTSSSGSWGSITTLTNNTTANAMSAQSLWSEFNMNSSDAVRMIYKDSQAGAVEYYTIALDSPPNAPTLNAVANFDATKATTFSWQFSDPDPGDSQSAFQLQILDVAAGTNAVDTGKTASTNTSYTVAANTLSNAKQYQWRVTTWDSSGQQGPYSAYSTFNTAGAPTTTVTSPTNNGTVTTSAITAQWSYSDPNNYAQQSFQVQLLASDDSTVLNDSGTVTSTGSQYTIPYTFANNTTYHVRVRTTNSQNVTSAWSDIVFSTSFTLPQQPSVNASSLSTQAKITIAMTNYASKNLVLNSGFEVVTTTATLFSDAFTSYTGSTVPAPWTLQSGSFTFGASGATSGATGSFMTAGNVQWKPVLGSDGTTKLALTAQSTFTTPVTLPANNSYEMCRVMLWQSSGNYYEAYISDNQNFFIVKYVGGVRTLLPNVAFTPSASTAYTITLSLDNTGLLTAKLYQGTNTSGTLLQTLTATDTSLTGGFLLGVGGDTGVVISNASCVGPWASSWTIGGDSRVAWGLTQSAIGGKYSVSAVGVSSAIPAGTINQNVTLQNTTQYTLSYYCNTQNEGSTYGSYVEFWNGSQNVKPSPSMGTSTTTRSSISTTSTATSGVITIVQADSGTFTFDNIQLEQGSTATPYIENDSTSSPQQAPAIAYNDVYRRNTGTSAWTRIATNISASGTYDDYAVASGQGYDYKVTAIGNNGTQVDSTTVTNQSISLTNTGLWVHDVNNPSNTLMNLQYYNASTQSADGSVPQDRKWTPAATSMQFAGRNRPVIEFGENDTFELSYKNVVMLATDGQWPILEDLIRVNKSTLCFRDGRGTMIFGCVLGYQETDLVFGNMVDLTLEQTAYTLAV